MSLFEQASLCITPNGTKASKLYAVKPVDGSGDLTVTRATTATRVNSAGLIESVASNVPRLDYSNGTCPSILVEPQRTNLALRSQEFDNASWSKGTITTITANTVISPDGTQNADTVTCNGSGVIFTRQVAYSGTTAKCSNSIYAKKGNTRYFGFRNFGDSGGLHDVFDFDTKTWTQNTSAILSYEELDNGWFRLKSVNSDSLGNYFISFFPTENTSGQEVDTVNNKFVYVWGAQAEIGNYATSYIPTTSASVTRNADVISKTGISSLIGQTEGTLFFDLVFTQKSEASYIGISNGTTGSRIILGCESDLFFTFGYGSGAVLSLNTNTRYKIALAYNSTNLTIYANGSLLSTITGTQPTSFSRFAFDAGDSTGNLISSLNTSALWKTRLSNSELSTLTTI